MNEIDDEIQNELNKDITSGMQRRDAEHELITNEIFSRIVYFKGQYPKLKPKHVKFIREICPIRKRNEIWIKCKFSTDRIRIFEIPATIRKSDADKIMKSLNNHEFINAMIKRAETYLHIQQIRRDELNDPDYILTPDDFMRIGHEIAEIEKQLGSNA